MTDTPDTHLATYPPLNTLKPVTEDVWIVDGPVIRFGMPWPKFTFATRMTVIRLPGRKLFIHSPTPLTSQLRVQIANIGTPTWLIGPNRIHYWWLPQWHDAYPDAQVFLAPRIKEQAGRHIDFSSTQFAGTTGYPWDETIATLPIKGSFMTEVVFFHYPSRTLVLTDLVENFEPEKIGSVLTRFIAWAGAVLHPDGQMPRDMRLTYRSNRQALAEAVKTLIEWQPERVILAHGRWYKTNGAQELTRAFRWLLQD